jgi:primosomal protein N' (replication factor Y)
MSIALDRNEQVILFLNRRGTFTFIQCRDCDFVPTCRHCLSALNYHESASKLICHHCHYSYRLPIACPQCSGQRFRFLGIGTQRVEQETRRIFPKARVIRWDSDVTTGRKSHQSILSKFINHEADILIGTQIIAKGLDFPMVTLAGVINADIGLNLPDFRAGERTFQLACQIAGRAGRGMVAGKVIIQTYNPTHYAIKAASKHDYLDFYSHEIDYRRQFGYPPFSQLARLVFSHTNSIVCGREAQKMNRIIIAERDRTGIPDLRIIGPMPAFLQQIRGRYQWQIILRGKSLSAFLSDITFPSGWSVDIDPVSVI